MMSSVQASTPHTFHIPVMGTGFTIDTPVKVARYGISSVISLVDDLLAEQMRQYYCEQRGATFDPIGAKEDDYRARRITAYLDMVDRMVQEQVEALQTAPFAPGSEITRYFKMCPDGDARALHQKMCDTGDVREKARLQSQLRALATPGSIDVNIMSKSDCERYKKGKKLPPEFSDAMAALRGYANSTLRSSIIFSAGLNNRLYQYLTQFKDFYPLDGALPKKRIVLKVSDYRSARVQGKFMAKRGLWISEYRIESGLNCGGHAFPSTGLLMGPILEEFRSNRESLIDGLFTAYQKALDARDMVSNEEMKAVRITVQGGIGTAEEDNLLRNYYAVDGTGWATPFLLVPEATNMDDEHLERLRTATDKDVRLSGASPFGLPFWSLRNSASEVEQAKRVKQGNPGSLCPSGFIRFNSEFTEQPICMASKTYQKRKLVELEEADLTEEQRTFLRDSVLEKCCICHDLAGAATKKLGIDNKVKTAVCCGPNIVNFSKVATLEEMVSHIYGRLSLITNPDRPHMFIRELALYVDYLKDETKKLSLELSSRSPKYFHEYTENLLAGVDYYKQCAAKIVAEQQERFENELERLRKAIEGISMAVAT